jgi:hypothetical protein
MVVCVVGFPVALILSRTMRAELNPEAAPQEQPDLAKKGPGQK